MKTGKLGLPSIEACCSPTTPNVVDLVEVCCKAGRYMARLSVKRSSLSEPSPNFFSQYLKYSRIENPSSPMFSRLLGLFNPLESDTNQLPIVQQSTEEGNLNPVMVTTRRQSGHKSVAEFNDDGEALVEGVNKDEVPAELLSPESRKRRRERAKEVEAPSSVKKRKLPLRGHAHEEKHEHWEKEIPVSELPGHENGPNEEVVAEESAEGPEEQATLPAEERKPEKSPRKKASPSKPQISKPVLQSPFQTPPTKPKHKKFSDTVEDEPIPLPEPLALAQSEIPDSEAENSDDDAPEEVGAVDAERAVKDQAREKAKAAEL
jgi:hypothetical protein